MSITGTFCVRETPDHVTTMGGIGTLGEVYTLMLLRRDAEIWTRRTQQMFVAESEDPIQGSPHKDLVEKYSERKSDGRTLPGTAKKFWREEECLRCGTHYRYEGGSCVECLKRRNRAIKAAKRKAKANVLPLRPGLRGLRASQVKVVKAEPRKDLVATSPIMDRWSDH